MFGPIADRAEGRWLPDAVIAQGVAPRSGIFAWRRRGAAFNEWAERLPREMARLFERGAAGEPVACVRWSADIEAGIVAVNRKLRARHPVSKLTEEEKSHMRDPRPLERRHAVAVLDRLQERGIDVEALRKAV